jgi:hypothetical protein
MSSEGADQPADFGAAVDRCGDSVDAGSPSYPLCGHQRSREAIWGGGFGEEPMHKWLKIVTATLLLAASGGFVSAQIAPSAPLVSYPSSTALSPALSDLPNSVQTPNPPTPQPTPPPRALPPHGQGADGALQNFPGPSSAIQPKTKFGGIGANCCIPPDPNIAVGPIHIVQVVNSEMAVYGKSGNLIKGPVSLSSLWANLAACATSNAGDVIAQYDVLADRWLIAQLGSVSGPAFSECIAVSTTNDPTGAYYLYAYPTAGVGNTGSPCSLPGSCLNDYPKFGVWPTPNNSAYLATYNLFSNNGSIAQGALLCAYDRSKMLSGASAPGQICYQTGLNDQGYLPVDLDGAKGNPFPNTPAYFLNLASSTTLGLYEVDGLNFSGAPISFNRTVITVSGYTEACVDGGTCIAQPNPQALDSLGDRLMYRLAYRVFTDHAAMVVNHSISSGLSVGVRWYELRQSAIPQCGLMTIPTGFYVCQQGTFAPDASYRWMGSAAMDSSGNIAIGYSKSSSSINPSIFFTSQPSATFISQNPSCPPFQSGVMGTEQVMQQGSAPQSIYSHWGDYSSLRIDPSDDTTFWYTNEYYTSRFNGSLALWSTAIGSFKVSCGVLAPDFNVSSVSPSPFVVQRGSNSSAKVTVAGVTGSNTVTLSISGLPRRASASFNPNPVTVIDAGSGSSTLTITANSRTPTGNYITTITGKVVVDG